MLATGKTSACPKLRYCSIIAENSWNWFLACKEYRNLLAVWELDSLTGFAWGYLGNGTVKLPLLARVWFSLKYCTTACSLGERLGTFFHFYKEARHQRQTLTWKDATLWREDTRVSSQNLSKSCLKGNRRARGSTILALQQYISKNVHSQKNVFFQDDQNQDQPAVRQRSMSTLNWNELARGASHK